MSTQNAKPTGARRLVLLLAAVLTFAATVLLGLTTADVASATTTSTAAGSSSASTVPAPETCVGASTAGLISGVWGRTDITAGQRRDGPRSQLQIVSGHCVAAEGATGDASSTLSGPGPQGGESSAAAYGRAAHAAHDYGPGFEKEFVLENGQRADAVNLETREVVELKPNNPRAISLGMRQAQGYAQQLNQEYPGTPFTYRVQTYDAP